MEGYKDHYEAESASIAVLQSLGITVCAIITVGLFSLCGEWRRRRRMCGATPWPRPVLLSLTMFDYSLVFTTVLVCREVGFIAGYHSGCTRNSDADCK